MAHVLSHPYSVVMDSPLGKVGIRTNNKQQLTHVEWIAQEHVDVLPQNKFFAHIAQEFSCYFANKQHAFDLAWTVYGTLFQQKVWQALCTIPYGDTLTYAQLAQKLKSSPRAIGQACRRNPLPLVIPCHRVIGSNSLGGYHGDTQGRLIQIKQWLLMHEKTY